MTIKKASTHLKNIPQIYFKNRAAWRAWLKKNYEQSSGIWLIYDKKNPDHEQLLSPAAITEEALCFGWIDSLPRTLNTTQTMVYLAPRKEKSSWSALNRTRAQALIQSGRMQPAGLAKIIAAKKNGSWKALIDVQKLVVPPDLQKSLAGNKIALDNFSAFPPSSKRIILEWILSAKKPETRARRISETVELAAKNIRANHYRQP